jgi:adenine-specific DNA-methyltransferase
MDEIFGGNNFITNIMWQKIHSIKNDAKYISINHDFITVYAKQIAKIRINLLSRSSAMDSRYKNPDNDPRGPWQSGDLVANEPRKDGNYDVVGPTGKIFNVPLDKHWVYSKTNLMKMIEENRIWFGKKGDSFPRKKRFLTEVQQGRTPDTWWSSIEVGHNQEAKREIKHLLQIDNQTFATPKPVRLIKRILEIATDKNSLILDSFSGSGTTAHAVMELNKEDGGNRRFILVELEEKIAKEVTAERIRRVINGHASQKQDGTTEKVQGLGGGFRYCRLGEPLFDKFGNIRQGVKFKELARHICFSETGVPLPEKSKLNTPLLGIFKGTAYYLLFNGIRGDKTINGGNVLTSRILESLPKHTGPKIVFGESNRLSSARLKKENIVFKQIPYEIKTS